jgi:hypothetical protein
VHTTGEYPIGLIHRFNDLEQFGRVLFGGEFATPLGGGGAHRRFFFFAEIVSHPDLLTVRNPMFP